MSGRTEKSTTLQDPNVEADSTTNAVIALIGPNATHRRVMAKALTGVPGRAVREFSDYPPGLSEIHSMMEEGFDVVMIDVDSDQSYALQIVETIAAFNTAIVMVYSMRNDADLLRECMRAGARDFLPLPEDADGSPAASETIAPQPVPEREPPVASPTDFGRSDLGIATPPVPAPAPEAPANNRGASLPFNPSEFLLPDAGTATPSNPASAELAPDAPLNPADFLLPGARIAAPERDAYEVPSRPQFIEPHPPEPKVVHEPCPELRPLALQPSLQHEELQHGNAQPKAEEAPQGVSAGEDFSAWDTEWILSAKNAQKAADAAASAAEPVQKKKAERHPVHSGPQLVPRVAQPVPAAPQPVQTEALPQAQASPLFSPIDADKSALPRSPWVRLAIFAGIPAVLVGLVMLIFMAPSRSIIPGPAPDPAPAATAAAGSGAPEKTSTPFATAKPSAAVPATTDQPQPAPTPVEADMMNAQLAAPSRIASQVTKPDSGDAPPDSFSPNAIDNGANVPGSVFGSSSRVKIVPGVSAISAGVAEGMLVRKTEPVYPQFAKSAHVSGTVVLAGAITKSGTLAGLHVLSGPVLLRGPALDAVKNWRYRPYMLNNQPIEVQTTIRLIFSLDRH